MGEETDVEQAGAVHESSSSKAQPSSSDALIADLLNDVKSSNKPFTTDDVANAVKGEKKHKKEHKQHKKKSKKEKKEKKSKKEKKRHRSRSRERSHSRKHKKKERKRSRSNSSTPSWQSLERNGNIKKDHVDDAPPAENKPRATSPEGSEDSLPVGADYLAVYNETVADANAANCKGDAPLDLAKLPVQAPLQPSKASFPLSKNTKESGWVEVPESDILKKVMETKGKPDMVPRNLKIVQDKPRSNADSSSGVDAKKTVLEASAMSAAAVAETKKIIMNIKSAPPAEPLVMKKEGDVKQAFGPQKPHKKESKKRLRSRSLSSEERHKSNRRRSPAREWRDRERRSPDRRRRSRSRDRERRRSRSRDRRRSRSRDRRRSRSRDRRRSRSRDRRRSRSRSRRRSPGIDKEKLREIAEHNRKFGYIPGVGADGKPTKTIGEMIAHCARLQRREEKEHKRAKGQVVSSDSEMSDYEAREPSHLPPAVASTIPVITFNIANATNLPTRTPQERLLESGQLRVCYPVSSGLTHREKTDEWTPVQKAEPVPSVCTNAQKRLLATSSKDKEKAKAEGRSVPDYVLPILPPPPIAPDLYGGGVPLGAAYISLPPPPPPPTMEGEKPSYKAQPPPDSLTPLMITPDASHLIMKEPEAFQESVDMSTVMQRRADAAKRLLADPNDYKARKEINRADEQMRDWASSHHLPGAFTGHNGVRILSQEELGPHDPRYNAWVKKDQFKSMRPVQSAVGRRLMEKMGWKPGEGLGKWGVGAIEPLSLQVKSDRKGLAGEGDAKKKNPTQVPAPGPVDVHGKNPVSLLMEYCAKKRWNAPQYVCEETGPPNNRLFMWKVSINGIVYHPSAPSCVKKTGKAVASHVALQALGLAPRSDVANK